MKIVELNMEDMKGRTLLPFYMYVAECLGIKDEDVAAYDCRKICVADNVQDSIIKAYQKQHLEEYMRFPADVDYEIFQLLALRGPKRDCGLLDGQVRVEEGFITWKTEKGSEICQRMTTK